MSGLINDLPLDSTPAGSLSIELGSGDRTTIDALKATFQAEANTAGKASVRNAEGVVTVSGVQLDPAATPTQAEGQLAWDATEKALKVGVSATESLTVGEEMTPRYRNATGSTLVQGEVVYVNGATGSNTTVARAQANALATSRDTIGVVTDDAGIANNQRGRICILGRSNNLNTSAWAEGTELWLSPTVAGGLTSTKPTTEGQYVVLVGVVERQHASQGVINVTPHFYGSVTGEAVSTAASKSAARTAIDALARDGSDVSDAAAFLGNVGAIPATEKGAPGGVALDDLSSAGSRAALARTGFPSFRRTWNTLAGIAGSSATGQLRFGAFGDSLGVENGAQKYLVAHLRTLYGFAGMITPVGFAGGSFPVAFNGAAVNSGTDYAVSPFGKFVLLDASGEGTGNYFGNGSVGYYPFATPQNSPFTGLSITDVVVYYTKESGAGSFKVQTTTDGSVWTDVAGLTAVSAANAVTELGIATASISAQYVKGVRALWVSGAVKIIAIGGWHATNPGIVQIESSVGGMDIGDFAGSPLTPAWITSINPQLITFSARDGVTDADPEAIAENIAALQALLPVNTEQIYYGIPQASTDSEESILAYDEAVREAAEDAGGLFLSYYDFANYAQANALGWMNGVHPTNEFASRLAQATLNALGISIPVHGLGRLGSVLTLPRLNSIPAAPDNGVRLSADSGLGFVIQSPSGSAKIAVPTATRNYAMPATSGTLIGTDSDKSDRTTLPGQLWVSTSNARGVLNNTGGATNEKLWDWRASGVTLAGRVVNDADSSAANWVLVNRVGASVQAIYFPAPLSLGSGATQITRMKHGTAVLVSGTATVADTSISANSRIMLTSNVDGGTPGWLRVSARSAGASFTITSSSVADTSTVAYTIIEP